MGKRLSKNNSITEGELFAALSRRSNSLNENVCKEVYYGLIKVIVDQFRGGKEIILPGLGKLYVHKKPGQNMYMVGTKTMEWVGPTNQIEFVASVPLKDYINSIDLP